MILTDLPPEMLSVIATNLLRSCATEVGGSAPSMVFSPSSSAHPTPDLLLVDRATWAAAAPAAAVCTALRRALLGAIGGLVFTAPATYVATALNAVTADDGGVAATAAASWDAMEKIGGCRACPPHACGTTGGCARRSALLNPVTCAGVVRTASLVSFAHSCPRLGSSTWAWLSAARSGGARGETWAHLFLLRSPRLPCRAPRRGWRAAAESDPHRPLPVGMVAARAEAERAAVAAYLLARGLVLVDVLTSPPSMEAVAWVKAVPASNTAGGDGGDAAVPGCLAEEDEVFLAMHDALSAEVLAAYAAKAVARESAVAVSVAAAWLKAAQRAEDLVFRFVAEVFGLPE